MQSWAKAWPESYFIMTESGGIDSESWLGMCDVVTKVLPAQSLLLLDGHKTRTSSTPALIRFSEAEIEVVKGVPHATHIQQVLDVAFFSQFQTAFDELKGIAAYRNEPLTVESLIKMAKQAQEGLFPGGICKAIIKGFRKTGVVPFNADIFPESAFAVAAAAGNALGDLREASGMPRSIPESRVTSFGPLVSPVALNAFAKAEHRNVGRTEYLTGYANLAHMMQQDLNKEEAEKEKAAAAATRKAAAALKKTGLAEKKALKEAAALAKAAAAPDIAAAPLHVHKKRKRSAAAPESSAADAGIVDAAAQAPPAAKRSRKAVPEPDDDAEAAAELAGKNARLAARAERAKLKL